MLRRAASLSVHRACASLPTLAMSQRSMVTVKVDDRGVGLITFNNPEKVRNARNESMRVWSVAESWRRCSLHTCQRTCTPAQPGPRRFTMLSSRVKQVKFHCNRSVKAKRHVCRFTMLVKRCFMIFFSHCVHEAHAGRCPGPVLARTSTEVSACCLPEICTEQSSSPSSARRACLQLDTILNMCSPVCERLLCCHTHTQLNALRSPVCERLLCCTPTHSSTP